MRLSKREKRIMMCWLATPGAVPAAPFLHRLRPTLWSRLGLAWRDLRRNKVLGFARYRTLYVPSTPHIKVLTIRRHLREFGIDSFVETGTFLGRTTAAIAPSVTRAVTIELSPELHARAVERFTGTNVTCLLGDSGVRLAEVLRELRAPALFWLDAHYSAGITANAGYDPIDKELAAIFAHDIAGHVVLVDDARGHDLPAIRARVPSTHDYVVRNDIARITPRR